MRVLATAVAVLAFTRPSGAGAEERRSSLLAAHLAADRPRVSLEAPGASLRRGFVRSVAGDATVSPIATESATAEAPFHRTLYLNRHGGEYTGGNDDSTINRSSVIAYYRTAGGTLSPFPYGDDLWDAVVACVEERYAPFGMTVTDEDPGETPHLEIAVAGRPEEIGLPAGCCLGVAPFSCTPIENAVSYAFAAVHPDSVEDLCWTILQESAHTLGLDHELLCSDAMTYLSECGPRKVFADEEAPCGEDNPRGCMCSGDDVQNSVDKLRAVVGDHHDGIEVFTPDVEAALDPRDEAGLGCSTAHGGDPAAGAAALLLALVAWLARRAAGR